MATHRTQSPRRLLLLAPAGAVLMGAPLVAALRAASAPVEVQLPGTQPLEVGSLTAPEQCDNCHGGYDLAVEPAHTWRGGLMAHASIDPLFWATLAVSEQGFDGAGDLCLRCHVMDGWLAGRSEPTDGSALLDGDANGVSCHLCHRLTNPDGSEHVGVQNAPFLANDGGSPAAAYIGNGMAVLLGADVRLGPYDNATSNNHATDGSAFHRSGELCGTCHDVSNPITGDLAHDFGSMTPLAPGTYDGSPGGNVEDKAAFNNPPFAYGAVERTYSEWRVSGLADLPVAAYGTLPAELQAGSLRVARDAAVAVRPDGNYVDGDPRTFTCQTCHMRPTQGKGARQNSAPVRADLPLHDLTGGSTWMPDAISWMDAQGTLHLGGGLSADERAGLAAGKTRARETLRSAASLTVDGDQVRVVNLTGHKLPTGYPEGRRMWLHVRWYDEHGLLVREDGAYGPLQVQVGGAVTTVETLLDPHDPELRDYVIEPGITAEWAGQLLGWGWDPGLVLEYDRVTGAPGRTLGDLAAQPAGTAWKTNHFALNNTIVRDTRIPPYGMGFDDALARSILPVPRDQYGDPGPGGVYDHGDSFSLDPPAGAVAADLRLLYQSTSWEFVQFLELANDGSVASLASAGTDLRRAWQATGMSTPEELAAAVWFDPVAVGERYCDPAVPNSSGLPARLGVTGSPLVADHDLGLVATGLPSQVFGIFVVGDARAFVPQAGGSEGNLCVGGTIGRFPMVLASGASGSFQLDVDLGALPVWPPHAVVPGESWAFQGWFRDAHPTATSNYTDAVEVRFR